MNPLTHAFLSLNTDGFRIALLNLLQNNGFLHPRFADGLLLIDEFDFYIQALRHRVNPDNPYIIHALACEQEYKQYQYNGIEPLTLETQQKIMHPGYVDEFGNHNLIAAVETKNVWLVHIALETYPDLINVPGKFGDRALGRTC